MSGRSQRSTIQCSVCNRIMPADAPRCRYCGTETGNSYDYGDRESRSRQEGLAAVAACLVLAQGIIGMLIGFEVLQTDVEIFGGNMALGGIGLVRAAFGLGMLLRQSWASMILQWVCIAGLFWDGCGLMFGLSALTGKDGSWIVVLMEALSMAVSGFAVYVIHNEGG